MAAIVRVVLLSMLVALAAAKFQLRPYPKDCATFYSCSSEKCPDGMTFDPVAMACYPPLRAHNQQRIQPREQTEIFPDESDNTIYWICTRMPCPPGLEFNPIKLVCEDPKIAGCRPGH